MAMSPMQRTLKYLRERGRKCGIVERFVHNKNVGFRSDLFHIFDIVAMSDTSIIGVQCCGSDFSAHYRKITVEYAENAAQWLSCGGAIELWGWRKVRTDRGKKEMRWSPRMQEITLEDIL